MHIFTVEFDQSWGTLTRQILIKHRTENIFVGRAQHKLAANELDIVLMNFPPASFLPSVTRLPLTRDEFLNELYLRQILEPYVIEFVKGVAKNFWGRLVTINELLED